MRSDKQQSPNSDLSSTRIDGATPFHYRSRVRSLLGIPDREEGQLVFSPTVPPVGFRYANHPFMNEPFITQYPPTEAGPSAWHDEPEVGLEVYQAIVTENIPQHTPSPAEMVKDVQPRFDEKWAMPESTQEKVAVESNENSDKPVAAIERGGMEIPGVTEKPQHFPALSPSKKDDIPPNPTPPSTGGTRGASLVPPAGGGEARYQQEISPVDSPGDFVRSALFEAQAHAPIINPMSPSERLPKESLAVTPSSSGPAKRTPGTERENDEPLALNRSEGTNRRPGASHPPPITQESVTGDMRTVSSERKTVRTNQFSPRMVPLSASSEERSEFNPYQTPGASLPVSTDTANRSNREAAERIEQLRHTVHELASKISSQQSQIRNETQQQPLRSESPDQRSGPEQTPSPPPQPVVIIKQSSNRARTPCAFWERSYLGRFHLRLLR